MRIALPGQINSGSLVDLLLLSTLSTKEFGYELVERPIEIVNLRLEAMGKTSKPITEKATQNKTEQVKEIRSHFGSSFGWKETPVYERADISHRAKVAAQLSLRK